MTDNLIEPSDAEQSQWPEATEAYVRGLEAALKARPAHPTHDTDLIPREPTPAMLMAGRRQLFEDMTGDHCGPNTELTWKAMYDAALIDCKGTGQ